MVFNASATARYAALVLISAALLAGCSGTVIFQMDLPVVENIVLAPMPANAADNLSGAKFWEDWADPDTLYWTGDSTPIPLGETCELGFLEAIAQGRFAELEALDEDLPFYLSWLINRASVEKMELRRMLLSARQGSFNFLSRAGLDLRDPGTGDTLFSLERSGAFDREVVLEPEEFYDLLDILGDTDDLCLDTFLTLEGSVPDQSVVFDIEAIIRLKIKIRLL